MTTRDEVISLEWKLDRARRDYLASWGWTGTTNTPLATQMWVRDFSKEDEERRARHPSPEVTFVPFGVIMADTNTALKMTLGDLDYISPDADSSE